MYRLTHCRSTPTNVTVLTKDGAIVGIDTQYSSGSSSAKDERQHGITSTITGAESTVVALKPKDQGVKEEHIVQVDLWSGTSKADEIVVTRAQFITDRGRIFKVNEGAGSDTHTTYSPPFGGWVLKGFWGASSSTAVKRLGCVWGPLPM